MLAEQIDACASAAAAARTRKSQSPPGSEPDRLPSSRPPTPLHCRPRARNPADITEVANGLAPH